MSNTDRKSFLNEISNIPLVASKDLSKDFPCWIRPFVRIIIYLLCFTLLVLLSPLGIVSRVFRIKHPNAYQKLKKELEKKRYTDSSKVALNDLRHVFEKIKNNMEKAMLGGVKVEPYGKFHFYQYLQVGELLYHWEVEHNNYNEAKELCDHVLNESDHENSKDKKPYEGWVVKKSYVINCQEGNIAAQEYLLKYVNPENKNSPVKNYLYQLREEAKE